MYYKRIVYFYLYSVKNKYNVIINTGIAYQSSDFCVNLEYSAIGIIYHVYATTMHAKLKCRALPVMKIGWGPKILNWVTPSFGWFIIPG